MSQNSSMSNTMHNMAGSIRRRQIKKVWCGKFDSQRQCLESLVVIFDEEF